MSGDKPLAAELERLRQAREDGVPWRAWGPYLSERQWGTVREDYSANGDAWGYFSHDQARSRAYRWGEDGLAGISDDDLRLCFAIALWNGRDPILKERVFGLTNREGNHGEDPKEYYHYLDATPTNSYLRYLYRYPQAAYPYDDLVKTNASRGRDAFEYELIDTGVFDEDRYFDVVVEYAKAAPTDIGIRITVTNRGPDAATLHLLPTLWFRNTWWRDHDGERPVIRPAVDGGRNSLVAAERGLGDWSLAYAAGGEAVFTDNETGAKDAFHRYVVDGDRSSIKPAQMGTKAAIVYRLDVGAGESRSISLRLGKANGAGASDADDADALIEKRRREADEFYESVIPGSLSADEKLVMRQALAGMLWSKQYYEYDLHRWLAEHGVDPFNPLTRSRAPRNIGWQHMDNADVISMPDKWEYPWYAAWDLAFHVLALTLVDSDFAKGQLELLLRARYQHPNGQVPAYEWNFGDVNPPVHAWATIFAYRLEEMRTGSGDVEWLERMYQSLVLNFTWWVNRKDRTGNNLFEGGFLGLDNIGVFDRSSPLPTGGYLEQADGTAWMALFCQNMLEISIALSLERPAYGEIAAKFLDHFLRIATAVMHAGADTGMWDEEDGFFYDVLRRPDGTSQRLKVRSVVGLLPLCAATVFEGKLAAAQPELAARIRDALIDRHELRDFIHDPARQGVKGRGWPHCSMRASCGASLRACSTRTSSSATSGSVRYRASTPTTRTCSKRAGRSTASPISRPSPTAACSAATRIGAGRCGCR